MAGHAYILERRLKPKARKDIIELLRKLDVKPKAMTGISDGLACEAIHIARASGLCVRIYDEKLPIDPGTYSTARDFNLDPTTCALNGGADYEMLFTIAQADFEKIKGTPTHTVVGHMTDKARGYCLVDEQGASTSSPRRVGMGAWSGSAHPAIKRHTPSW